MSLVVQWLGLHAPNEGGPGSISGQGTRSHMPQLKILLATTTTQLSQVINIKTNRKQNSEAHSRVTERKFLDMDFGVLWV